MIMLYVFYRECSIGCKICNHFPFIKIFHGNKFVTVNKMVGGDGLPEKKDNTQYEIEKQKVLDETNQMLENLEKEFEKTQ